MADTFLTQYAREAVEDIKALRAYDRQKVLAGIEQHLTHEPTKISRRRIKRMVRPFWSQFRLRIDDVRVYYDVDEAARMVNVLRVLSKTTGQTPGAPT